MELKIRAARLTDVPRLLMLYRQLDIGAEPQVSVEPARARFLDLSSNPHHRIFVAEAGDEVVGTFAMIFVPGISHGGRDSCVVEDVVVSAPRQGSGVGRQMMNFAMQVCAERGCYKLVLSSHVDRDKAHRFYEGLGFERHGYSFLVTSRSLQEPARAAS